MADFVFTNLGSVWQIEAVSQAAKDFAEENFPIDGWQGTAERFYTDWRPAEALAHQLQSEGWDVRDGGRHY